MHYKYQALIKQHSEELQKHSSSFNVIGYTKLILIAILGLAIYLAFSNSFALGYITLLVATLVATIILWAYHAKLSNKINYIKGLIAIYNRHLCRINGQWVNFKDTGAEFSDPNHVYASDLDIVGNKSLFQFLNTTHTWHGRQAFANDLLHPMYGKWEIEARQKSISELSQDIEFSSMIQYYLSKIGIAPTMPDFIKGIKDDTAFIENKIYRTLLTFIPIVTFLFIIGAIVFQQRQLYLICIIIAGVQLIVWGLGASKASGYLSPVAKLPYRLNTYNEILNKISERKFVSKSLIQTQEKLREAKQAIKDLSKITDKISLLHNPILYFLANIFLLWDYHCALLLQEWKQKYALVAEDWFLAIGEFESMLSFSHLPNICSNTSLPIINEKSRAIEANGIGHPLLPNNARVNNDFNLHDNILIVSGSNMSGKTTFLRTIGINIVLARTGGFVCAKDMQLAILGVVTSMRLADDLNEGVSTFYAELKRIKAVIELAKAQPNTVFLIDEIFRGTNSVDRLAGAKGVIENLNNLNAMGLLSTHDLELCELESTYKRIRNYSFSEHYKDDKLIFDYKLKSGKSNTTNANYLMKMVGIID